MQSRKAIMSVQINWYVFILVVSMKRGTCIVHEALKIKIACLNVAVYRDASNANVKLMHERREKKVACIPKPFNFDVAMRFMSYMSNY